MFIYQPTIDSDDRVVWYGGESTQLHYEVCRNETGEWIAQYIRNLGNGVPAGMSEMHAEMVEYYNYCQITENI